jgi:hypothetical protein
MRSIVLLLLLASCGNYVIEKKIYGLNEQIIIKGKILKIDTVSNDTDGTVKRAIVKIKKNNRSIYD